MCRQQERQMPDKNMNYVVMKLNFCGKIDFVNKKAGTRETGDHRLRYQTSEIKSGKSREMAKIEAAAAAAAKFSLH